MPVQSCEKYTATLSEILAITPATQTIADATDVPGVRLEWMKTTENPTGKWYGDLGTMPKATADALYASGALANLAAGATYRDTSGTQYTYSAGAGWVGAASVEFDSQTSGGRNRENIQSKLDAGGLVEIRGNGVVYIDDRLVIKSNTTLVLDSAIELKMAANRNVCLIKTDGTPTNPTNYLSNITIDGGIWNGNFDGGNTAQCPTDRTSPLIGARGALNLIGVKNLTVKNLSVVNANGFAIHVMGEGFVVKDIFFDTLRDGIHVSTSSDFLIQNISGTTGDDFIAINAQDWITSAPVIGPIKNGIIKNIRAISCGSNVLKLFAGSQNDADISGIIAESLYCKGTLRISMSQDADLDTPAHTYGIGRIRGCSISGVRSDSSIAVTICNDIDAIEFRDFSIPSSQSLDVFSFPATNLQGITPIIGDIRFNNFTIMPLASAKSVFLFGAANIRSISIDAINYLPNGAWCSILRVLSSATIKTVTLECPSISTGGSGFVYIANVSGVIDNMSIIGGSIETSLSQGDVPPITLDGSGVIKNITVNSVQLKKIPAFLRTSSTTPAIAIEFVACLLSECKRAIWAASQISVSFYSNSIQSQANELVRLTDAAAIVSVKTGGNIFSTLTAYAVTAGTIRWNGLDIPLAETGLTPTKWDNVMSTASANGPMLYDGSAWVKWGHL